MWSMYVAGLVKSHFLIYIIYLKLLFGTNWLIDILEHWILPGKSITTADYFAMY